MTTRWIAATASTVCSLVVIGLAGFAVAQTPSAPGAGDTFSTSTGPSGAAPLQGSVSASSCQQAYSQAQLQLVEAGTRLDAQHKKDEIDCNGKQSCIRAAQKKYSAAQREIAKQKVGAEEQNNLCREQAQAGGGGAQSRSPTAAAPPLSGGVSQNAP